MVLWRKELLCKRVSIIFTPYYCTDYFGFATQEMAILPISAMIGGFLCVLIAPNLGYKFDEKMTTLWSGLIVGLAFIFPFQLRMLGFFPENGSSLLSELVGKIKANSSKWIKTKGEQYANFYWQNGYGRFSVNPTETEVVIKYIQNQEEHHKKRTFKEKYRLFLKKYKMEYDEQYVWD